MANVSMVMAAEVPDEPGALSRLVKALSKEKINLSYAYSFLPKNTTNAIIIFKVKDADVERTKEILTVNEKINLLEEDELLTK